MLSDVLKILGITPRIKKSQSNSIKSTPPATPTPVTKPATSPEAYGKAQVMMDAKKVPQTTAKKYTIEEVRKIIETQILENFYERYEYEALLNNLDKMDLDIADKHIENLKIYRQGNSNHTEKIIKKGYFFTKEGAEAFSELSKLLDSNSKQGYVSELSKGLADYDPNIVLLLKKRNLLTKENIYNDTYLNKLGHMNDEEFNQHMQRAEESIQKTGKTYEELLSELKNKIIPHLRGKHEIQTFLQQCGQKDAIVAQLEMFDIFKQNALNISSLIKVLSNVDTDNIEEYKLLIEKIKNRPNASANDIESLLMYASSSSSRRVLSDLLKIENMTFEKIKHNMFKYNNALAQGIEAAKKVEDEIKNDPIVATITTIKNSNIDLKPSNTTPTPLDIYDIKPSSLVLVHMTDYEPENGKILSTREKINGTRNSVHFTLNHAVEAHRYGDWDNKKYAIIMPYETTIEANEQGKFIEGMPNDIYTNGSVKIPKGSIMVKQNEALKKGEINITKHPTIKDVKVIECAIPPHDVVPSIIEKMNYSYQKANGIMGLFNGENKKTVSETLKSYDAWVDFCNSQGIKENRHTGSIGSIIEKTIENTGIIARSGKSWIISEPGRTVDIQEHFLQALKFAKSLEEKGYFSYLDLNKLHSIIKNSETPNKAIEKIEEEFNMHPVGESTFFNLCSSTIDIDIYNDWYTSKEDRRQLINFFAQQMRYES